jgi:hypothetical protein
MVAHTGGLVFPTPRRIFRARGGGGFALPRPQVIGLTRAFAFAVVFLAGWYLCLPETDLVQVPWWAAKGKFGPNLLVYEAIFAVYLVVGGARVIWREARAAGYATLPASVCLVLLAGWCAMASLLSPFPLHDVGRSARLVFLALLLLGVSHWAAGNPLLVLRSFLLGLIGSSVVNLILTFLNPVILVAGSVPRLLGQNSPGPPMGIAISLAAWLILLSRARRDTIIAVAAAIICGAGVMISYSKTGMLAAGMGFLSIAVVSGRVAASKRGRLLVGLLFVLVLGGAKYLGSEEGRRLWTGVSAMLLEKVESASPESHSVQERWSYVWGVSEIVVTHPIGVGYSGFHAAMMQTESYRSGWAADETSIPEEDSNPHSLFLYYASAGGLVGAALAIAVFVFLCLALFRGVGLYGLSGSLLALFSTIAFFVLAISVGYLFNSCVMLIPAAVSAGIQAYVRGAARASAEDGHEALAPAPAV